MKQSAHDRSISALGRSEPVQLPASLDRLIGRSLVFEYCCKHMKGADRGLLLAIP